MTKQKKCYIYIRVSTEMQVDGYSLDAQKDRLKKYAEYQNIRIIGEYCDAGKSGKSITGRPEFTRMLEDIASEKDGVDYVLVFKLSRFGRNAADVLNSLQYIQDFGVNLICVEDGIDSSRDSGKLTITVLSAVAEIERENILVQTMEGRKQKAREGKWNGGPAPYGYSLDRLNGTLVIDPYEAEVVKIIFDKFVNTDMGFERIANYLNTHGYEKTKNRDFEVTHFTHATIQSIIDNPVYAGKIAYGKTVTKKVKGTRDQYHRIKADDYLLADGQHEAIIGDELWERARAKRKETGVRWVKTHSLDHEHILSGLIRCPVCGGSLAGNVSRYHRKKDGTYSDRFYYKCLRRKPGNTKEKCSFTTFIKQDEINAEVEGIVLDIVNNEASRKFIMEKINEKVDVSGLEKERDTLRAKLNQVAGAKKKLTEQMDRLDVSDKHYDRKIQDMQDRLDNLYDRMGDLESSIREVSDMINSAAGSQNSAEQVYEVLVNSQKLYDHMTDLEKKEFYRNIIQQINLYPEQQADGRWVKSIEFRLPVSYDAEKSDSLVIDENGVETVALMSKKK